MRTLDLAKPLDGGHNRPAWRDRLDAWMDRKLTDPGFSRWAAANVVTRWITRRRAQQVFDVMAGFVYSQVLLACVRLRILELVNESPRTLDELAQICHVPASALQRLINSAVALRLLSLRGQGRYGLGALGAPVAGHPGIRAMIEHHAVLYHDMQDPVALLRDQVSDGQMMAYWPYVETHIQDLGDTGQPQQAPRAWEQEKVSRYSQLMSASQPFVVDEVLATYSFARHQCVLDVGGGQGTFVSRLAGHAPHLKLKLFDLPQVAALAQDNFRKKSLSDRADAFGGDFLKDSLPEGADLVTLIRVAHDHPDAHVNIILRAIFKALPAGGTLLLTEPMAQASDEAPLGDAYFHFYLLAMGSGRLRTVKELSDMLVNAGFDRVDVMANAMPLQTRILVAHKK
jgi:demethylspheroidene O-methyltransferase